MYMMKHDIVIETPGWPHNNIPRGSSLVATRAMWYTSAPSHIGRNASFVAFGMR